MSCKHPVTENGAFIKHGETTDQVRVGGAVDERSKNTLLEREELLAQREERDSLK